MRPIFKIILISIFLIQTISAHGQMSKIISDLSKPLAFIDDYSNDEKLSFIKKMLPNGDSVQFKYPEDETDIYPSDSKFYPFNLSGVYLIDLDADGDLDLLYSGISGNMGLKDTKVFYNNGDQLEFHKKLNGRILDLIIKEKHIYLYTLWAPCCDSYTSRIEQYLFSPNKSVQFKESLSFIGRVYNMSGPPAVKNLKTIKIKKLTLFASSLDFRGTHPYFRKQNKVYNQALRKGENIPLIQLNRKTKVQILNESNFKNETWYLILTESINDVPKSIFEWSSGNKRRFIGWIPKSAIR